MKILIIERNLELAKLLLSEPCWSMEIWDLDVHQIFNSKKKKNPDLAM